MLVRMFGVFGIILGAAYVNEGAYMSGWVQYAQSEGPDSASMVRTVFVVWDFLFGFSLIAAAIGVLFVRQWGRMMWLGLMPALVFVHFIVIVGNLVFGRGVSDSYVVWTTMIVLVTVLSGWYLMKPAVRPRFGGQTEA